MIHCIQILVTISISSPMVTGFAFVSPYCHFYYISVCRMPLLVAAWEIVVVPCQHVLFGMLEEIVHRKVGHIAPARSWGTQLSNLPRCDMPHHPSVIQHTIPCCLSWNTYLSWRDRCLHSWTFVPAATASHWQAHRAHHQWTEISWTAEACPFAGAAAHTNSQCPLHRLPQLPTRDAISTKDRLHSLPTSPFDAKTFTKRNWAPLDYRKQDKTADINDMGFESCWEVRLKRTIFSNPSQTLNRIPYLWYTLSADFDIIICMSAFYFDIFLLFATHSNH